MRSLGLDLRAAVLGLLRNRSVTLLALGCLALGVGSSAAMLGLLDAFLFRPPAHVQSPQSVRRVYFTETFPGSENTASPTSYPTLRDLEGVKAFSATGAFFATEMPLGRGAEARKVRTVLTTPGFLRLLGVQPIRGRLFADPEGEPGQPAAVALLGYDLWRRGFGGAPGVLGRQITAGGDSYTIVGVLPRRFTGVDLEAADLWLPMNAASRLLGPRWAEGRGNKFLEIVVRQRTGIRDDAAAWEATAAFRAGAAESGSPSSKDRVSLGPIQRGQGPYAPASLGVVVWLSGLSWVVLLVSCANVASLLLLRSLDRHRELGLRLALGAGSGRVARLVFFEGVVLAVLGGLGALLVRQGAGNLLQRLILPEATETVLPLDLRTLGLIAALVTATAVLSGGIPALWVRRRDLVPFLRSGFRERSPARSRLEAALAAAQIALTVVLLAGGFAFARSLYNVLHLDLGLDADRLLIVTPDLESLEPPPARLDEFFRLATERVRALPGVEQASLAATIPFATSMARMVSVPGIDALPQLETGGPYVNAVSEGFFSTTGTRIMKGRDFTSEDRAGAAPVVVVNQTMARLLWPDRDAVGQCLKIGDGASPCSEVVGVAEDARRSGIEESPTMQFYVPLGQAPASLDSRVLFVRVAGEPSDWIGPVRREVFSVAPDLPFIEAQPLSSLIAPQIRPWRVGTTVLALFGLLALALALAGVYGVVAHAMARRSYEMGVRVALGAQWRSLLWLALRRGLAIGALGSLAGSALVLGAARYFQPLLFHASAKDPLALAAAAALVLALAGVASYVPGRRLRRLDPTTVLRVE